MISDKILVSRLIDKNMMINGRVNQLSEIPSDPPPRCHPLTGNLNNKFAVDVSGNYRMIFEGYDKNDKLSIKKSEIVTIQIVAIDDYH